MKTVSLSGSPRENVGKKDAKKVRNEGRIPCVLYGGEKQIQFTVDAIEFDKMIFTPEIHIIKIDMDGKEYETILQDVQYHPVTDKVLHVDFLELIPGKMVTIAVPVKLVGKAEGVLQGGKLHKKKRKLVIKALKDNLPDYIEIDISPLDIGDSIKIEDLQRENITFLDPPSDMVVGVKVTRIATGMEVGEEEEVEGEEGEEGEEGAESSAEDGAAEGGEQPEEG